MSGKSHQHHRREGAGGSLPGASVTDGLAHTVVEGEQTPVLEHFPSEHRAGLLPEKFFRWRAGEITRLEAFCDVIFGFALTLLVVSLEVPRNFAELMAAMRGFVPFAVCFAQLVMIWREHYRISRRYGLEDDYTVLLNMLLLFVVLFYVYPLKFVFTVLFAQITGGDIPKDFGLHEASVLMRIYASGFVAVFALLALMYSRALRLRGPLGLTPSEVRETRMGVHRNVILSGVGAASFCIAFKSPQWAGWIYCAIGPLFGIHGAIMGARARRLAEGK